MQWIVRPSDPGAADELIAGGKGASLARLHGLGARVPPFVVVSPQAYREMGASEMSRAFIEEVRAALEGLNADGGLAVRSSAIGEDAADSSFAGLYHTSLEVRGLEAVLDAIETCWKSYRDAHAVAYRETRTDERDGAMAVVIQEMIHGDWSGVSFTANPVTLALSEAVINAVPGLGEALVSGEVNPEEITVSAADGRVLSRHAGDQEPPLPPEAITAVWRESMRIAEAVDFPQDLEWAWRDGELFILQSRPITTIADVFYSRMLEPWKADASADPDAPGRVWSRMLADETWVSPISPLFYNIHNSTPGRVNFFRQHGEAAGLPADMFKYHRATAYCDADVIQRMYEFQPPVARIRGIQNFLPTERQEGFRRAPWRLLGRLRRMINQETDNAAARSFFKNYHFVEAQWPAFLEIARTWPAIDLDALSLEELRAHHAAVRTVHSRVGPACAVAVMSHAADLHMLMTGLLDRWLGHTGMDGENLYARISSGLEDSETLKISETLWQMGQRMRMLGSDALDQTSWDGFKAAVRGRPDAAGFTAAFEDFWRGNPHLGSTYKDLVWPRWGDDIDAFFEVVKAYADSAAVRPSTVNAQSAKARREAQAELLAALRGPLAPVRRRILRWMFRYNELYMAVRDDHRFYVDRNWYELRRIYRAYGQHLADAGVLAARDEVFFLGTAEVEDGLAGKLDRADAARRIEVRRRVWRATLKEQGPKFLKGWAPYLDRPAGASKDGEIHGIGASPGTAVGVARVVYDVRELSSVRDGDILVTRQTDPSWTTVFGRIGGLVLETGGVLSHGTSLCREYGLPCVTAVERATVRIPDGARIELAGSEGVIRILEPA